MTLEPIRHLTMYHFLQLLTVKVPTLISLFNDFSKEIVIEIKCKNCKITVNHSKKIHVSSTSQYVYIQ